MGLTQARRGIGNGGVDQELNFCVSFYKLFRVGFLFFLCLSFPSVSLTPLLSFLRVPHFLDMSFFSPPNPDPIFFFGLKGVCAVDYSTVRAAGLRLI